jgi:hypothetical protein
LLGNTNPDYTLQNGFSNPQLYNRYSYCGNNPLNKTDPDGHFIVAIPVVVCAVALAVVTVAIVYELYEIGNIIDSRNLSRDKDESWDSVDEGDTIVVDPDGNATRVKPGEKVEGTSDGKTWQVKDKNGKQTGDRRDGKGHPKQKDPKAQKDHVHRVGPDGKPITDSTENPHLEPKLGSWE